MQDTKRERLPERHELKYFINRGDMIALGHRLGGVLHPDPHADEKGEYFIRSTVARDICHRTAGGASVQAAADAEIAEVGSIGGDGGVIVMGADGVAAFAMNTSGMYRGSVASSRPPVVAIYADEAR